MKMKRENRLIVLLGCCLLALFAFGCSEKTVNNSPGDNEVVIDLDLQAAPEETTSLVDIWLLTVSGPDMDTVRANLRLVDLRYVTGQIEVPAGEKRHFVLEGMMGNVVSAARVIYRGSTVAPVRPGVVTTLNIVLHPVAAMVTMSPIFSEVPPGGTLNLAVKVYNVPGLVSFQSELNWNSEYLSNVWAARPPSQPEGVSVDLSHEGGWGNLEVASPIGNILTPLVDARGDGVLALLSFNVVTPVSEFPIPADIIFYGMFTLTTASGDTLGLDSILVEQPAASVRILPAIDRVVTFPDAVLDRHIRQLDSIPTGVPIMLSEVIHHTYLDFADLGVQTLAGLENLINLTYIYMNWNPTGSSISYLSHLPALASLYAEDNAITDIGALATVTALESLNLDFNFISDIAPLAGLLRLRYLELRSNQISDLSPLVHLTDLRSLYLGANQIVDLTPLQNLTELYYLDLNSNLITDILPLVNNPGLGQYDYIELWGNPALETDPVQQAHIATLRARGVTVIMGV